MDAKSSNAGRMTLMEIIRAEEVKVIDLVNKFTNTRAFWIMVSAVGIGTGLGLSVVDPASVLVTLTPFVALP